MSTPQSNENSTEWSPCPAGMLGTLGGRMRASETRRSVLKAAGGVASLAVVALLAVYLTPPSTTPGGISCTECLAQMPEYHLYLTADSDLTTADADAVAAHLGKCSMCRNHFEADYPGVLAATVSASLGWVSLALLGSRRA